VVLYGLQFIAIGLLVAVAIWRVPHRVPLQARLMPELIGSALWITIGVVVILRRVLLGTVLVWFAVFIFAGLAAFTLFLPHGSLLLLVVQTSLLMLEALLAFWYTRYGSR